MADAAGAGVGNGAAPPPADAHTSDDEDPSSGSDASVETRSEHGSGADEPVRRNPCDYNININPGPESLLATKAGLNAAQRKDLIACRYNCGAVLQKNSGVVYNRHTGEVHDDVAGCPKQDVLEKKTAKAPPQKRARQDRPATATSFSEEARKEAKRLGLQPHQVAQLPWKLDVQTWRGFLGLILAPSVADRRAAATAVETLRPFLGKAAVAAIEEGTAVGTVATGPLARFHDQLRIAMPFSRGDIVPRAAAIAAFLAIVDFNNEARKERIGKDGKAKPSAQKTITVPPSCIRRGATGPPIPAEDVVGLGLLKSMLDEGKAWFRDFVDRLVEDRACDTVHYVEASSTGKAADSKIVAWPYQWAHLRVLGYKRYVDSLPVDAPPPGMLNTLLQSGDLTDGMEAEEYDFTPCLTQAGTLRAAISSDVHAPGPRLALRALTRHARFVALKYYDEDIDTTSMASSYKAAIAAGVKVAGLRNKAPVDRQPADASAGTKRTRSERRRAARATDKGPRADGAAKKAAAAAAAHATAASAASASMSPPHRPSAAIPLPPPPGSGAAGAGAGSFLTGFKKCMACGSTPPSGTSKGPFCRGCYGQYNYDGTTGRVSKKP